MSRRSQWGSRAGFIMAAVGSAVGLGNIWRFPYVAYENGGGAFFIPYLFALLTAGIPILIMEFTIGHKYRGSAPLSFFRMSGKKSEWIGWWGVFVSFVISTYYSVIIAWAMKYTIYSFNLSWGTDTAGFLFGDVLNLADTPGDVGGYVPGVLIPLLLVWAIVFIILLAGVQRGIELANRIFIPMLIIVFLMVVIRAVTLDGALLGLDAFFKPDLTKLANPTVWVAAYGHIFFSLSIAFAIMITYSSYLPKKSDITNNAFITGFANSGFELLAGIGIFAALGFMATQAGTAVSEVADAGVGLAFVVFPEIINQMPGMNSLFGTLFFLSLVLAGISSLISICETYIAGISDKFNVSRSKSVIVGVGIAAVVSTLFATRGGLFFLDAADYFINQFGVAAIGLIEVILIAWAFRKLGVFENHANAISDIRLGAWWKVCLSVITPIVLGYMMFGLLRTNLLKLHETDNGNYEGYSNTFILFGGWSVALGALVLAVLFTLSKWKPNTHETTDYEEN
ncbi:sodium-dependent transporter [Sporosarcina pasteurii]|uniref:Transporter n=1 Tax=Sporosarcina pasteurii TaxID=1474 RepID=A0A380CAI0_SPOPA|nr:sodium-dependent transporter [Sporosarcina pasteurii]MDS9472769.1 sodium-dependent transporter [Sporosarcina pasteurii]QBQ04421.1 sodium-dependent transporter [Sporosarcina pasteurii]SUJ15212.1 Na+-dependent transporters of the SNF family [Sporosarcina pasteurii]